MYVLILEIKKECIFMLGFWSGGGGGGGRGGLCVFVFSTRIEQIWYITLEVDRLINYTGSGRVN